MRKLAALSLFGALACLATAQDVNAFKNATFSDLNVSQNGLTFTVTTGAHPMVDADQGSAGPAAINVITGFWILSDSGVLYATGSNFGNYQFHNNTGTGSTFGYQTQQRYGQLKNQSKSFTFKDITGPIAAYGFMVNAQGTPAHVRMNAVPEPATLAAIGVACAMLRRRKKA